jgi:hypothetical protein
MLHELVTFATGHASLVLAGGLRSKTKAGATCEVVYN